MSQIELPFFHLETLFRKRRHYIRANRNIPVANPHPVDPIAWIATTFSALLTALTAGAWLLRREARQRHREQEARHHEVRGLLLTAALRAMEGVTMALADAGKASTIPHMHQVSLDAWDDLRARYETASTDPHEEVLMKRLWNTLDKLATTPATIGGSGGVPMRLIALDPVKVGDRMVLSIHADQEVWIRQSNLIATLLDLLDLHDDQQLVESGRTLAAHWPSDWRRVGEDRMIPVDSPED